MVEAESRGAFGAVAAGDCPRCLFEERVPVSFCEFFMILFKLIFAILLKLMVAYFS